MRFVHKSLLKLIVGIRDLTCLIERQKSTKVVQEQCWQLEPLLKRFSVDVWTELVSKIVH